MRGEEQFLKNNMKSIRPIFFQKWFIWQLLQNMKTNFTFV